MRDWLLSLLAVVNVATVIANLRIYARTRRAIHDAPATVRKRQAHEGEPGAPPR